MKLQLSQLCNLIIGPSRLYIVQFTFGLLQVGVKQFEETECFGVRGHLDIPCWLHYPKFVDKPILLNNKESVYVGGFCAVRLESVMDPILLLRIYIQQWDISWLILLCVLLYLNLLRVLIQKQFLRLLLLKVGLSVHFVFWG